MTLDIKSNLFKDRDSVLNDMYYAREEIIKLDKLISVEADANELQLLQDLRNSQIYEYELNRKLYDLSYREIDNIANDLISFNNFKLEKDTQDILIKQFASALYKDTIKAIEVVPSSFLVIDFDNIKTIAKNCIANKINSLSCIDTRFNNLTNEDLNIRGVDAIVYLNDSSIELIDLKSVANENKLINKNRFGNKINYYITLELEKIEKNKYVDSYITDPLLLSEKIWYYVIDRSCVYVLDRLKLKDYLLSKNKEEIDLCLASNDKIKKEKLRLKCLNEKDTDTLKYYKRERNRHTEIDINVQVLIEKNICKCYKDFKGTEYSHIVIDK